MFESSSGGEPEGDGQAYPPDAAPPPVVPGAAPEENGVWGLHDWSQVPVDTSTDEPPAGWLERRGGWLDDLTAPDMGPVSWFGETPPSSTLMAELEQLPMDLVDTDYDALELVAHWDRMESYCAARKRTAAAGLARRELMAGGLANLDHLGVKVSQPNIAGDELALRLGIGKRAAVRLMSSGRAMTGVAIPTADALEAGEIDAVKADIIALGIDDLTPDEALEVQDIVLAKAPHLSSGLVRRELATARAKVRPEHFEERCTRAAKHRRVDRPRVLPDGMASLYAIMPAVAANQVYRAVDAAARSTKASGDPRTLDQLRADALGLMGAAAIDTGWIGTPPHTCDDAHADRGTSPSPTSRPEPPPRGARRENSAQMFAPRGPSRGPDEAPLRDERRPPDEPPTPDGSPEHDQRQGPDGPREPDRAPPPNPVVAATTGRAATAIADPGMPADPGDQGAAADWADPADAAAWSAAGAGVCPPLPGERMRVGMIGGKSAHIRVVVPLTSLMGGHDGPGQGLEDADAPADLEGYGPIPASVARALAAGGPWSRMVTDPVDRTVLELTTDRYEPPAATAALVRAAQPECAHPTCSISSDSCDLHHRIPWPAGPTTATNFDPECRRDHLLLTHAGWSCIQHADGIRTWTTATNHVYTQHLDGRITMNRPHHGPGARTNPLGRDRAASTQPVRRPSTADEPPPF